MQQFLKEALWQRLFPSRVVATELLIATLLINLLGFTQPIFVMQVLNRYVSHGIDGTLMTLAFGALLAVGMEFSYRQLRTRIVGIVCSHSDRKLSNGVFAELVNIQGDSLLKIANDKKQYLMQCLESVQNSLNANNLLAVLDLPFAVLFILVLWFLSQPIAILVICCIVFTILLSTVEHQLSRTHTSKMIQKKTEKQAVIRSVLNVDFGMLYLFDAQHYLRQIWQTISNQMHDFNKKLIRHQGFLQNLMLSIAAIQGIGVISIGAVFVVRGELTVGALICCNIIAQKALQPFTKVIHLNNAFSEVENGMSALNQLTSVPKISQTGTEIKTFSGQFTLKDLAFQYDNDPSPLFEYINCVVEPGSVVVIQGDNGSGKTTLLKLLAGLISPTRGQILIDGIDVRQLYPKFWTRKICYLPQEPCFMAATILDNITSHVPDLPADSLAELLLQTGLRPFLDKSKDGIGIKMSDNGQNVSLGIRRRIALARALASGGQLILFDEPTDGMDSHGQQMMYQILNEKRKAGATIWIATHDPLIVKAATHIINLNQKPIPQVQQVRYGN